MEYIVLYNNDAEIYTMITSIDLDGIYGDFLEKKIQVLEQSLDKLACRPSKRPKVIQLSKWRVIPGTPNNGTPLW